MFQTRLRFALLALVSCGVSVGGASVAHARPTGEAQVCGNCHYREQGPTIKLTFSKDRPSPGETVTITIGITANNAEAKRTGFMLKTGESGKFTLMDMVGTRIHDEGTALHAQPKTLVSGKAEFQIKWTAPNMAGVTYFDVFSVTGNTNGDSSDDHNSASKGAIAYGCDAKTYYPDTDKDGFGDMKNPKLSCQPIADYVLDGRDCNDAKAEVNPDAKDICNSVDDNCDGTIDEGLEPGLYYKDDDGDGYASARAKPEFTCNDKEGYVSRQGDCAPTDKNVHPGAKEVKNGVDDNCNNKVDETDGGGGSGGEGGEGGGSGGEGGDGGDGQGGEGGDGGDGGDGPGRMTGGCSVADGGPAVLPTLFFGALGLALAARKRRR